MAQESVPRHGHAPSDNVHSALSITALPARIRLTRWLMALALMASLLPLATLSSLAQTADITVTTTTDEDNGSLGGGSGISLREALLYSADGDEIALPAGVYNLTIPGVGDDTGVRGDLDVVGKAITIVGAGAATTRIAANFPNGNIDRDRVMDIQSGAGLTISGVTITGGSTAADGGGLRNLGTLNATGIVVSNNFSAVTTGGEIDGAFGGGIYSGPGTTAAIRDSELIGNTANRSGGGIYVDTGATVTIANSTIANNVAVREDGGGIANEGTATVTNSTFSGNSASRHGGGSYNNGATTVRNTTITNNIANADVQLGGDGGGAYNNAGTIGALTFRNSIIAGNQDLVTPDIPGFQGIFPDLSARVANTIAGNSSNLISSRAGINGSTTIGTVGQSDIVTVNIGLAALGSYGGATRTHLLLPTSPAVEAADDTICAAAPVGNVDQRGLARPADGDGNTTPICDIGSVEIRSNIAMADGATAVPNGGSVNFGSTPRDTPLTKSLTISNPGEAPLVIDDSSLTLPAGFALGSGFASTVLAPGATTTLGLTFTAATLGAATGTLSFATNAPESSPFSITLNATATPKPAILSLAEGATVFSSGALVNFGSTPITSAVDRTFTISNDGDETLTIGAITVPTGFTLQTAPSDTSLSVGESTTFTLRFLANTIGVTAGTATIPSNDANSPFELGLSGTVSESTTDQLFVLDTTTVSEVVNGGSVDFGSTIVGTPLERTFQITNIGDRALEIAEPTIPTGFSLVSGSPAGTLQNGESVDFTIQANAAAVGTPSGAVSFANDDTDENPFSFTVSATVAASPAQIVVSDGATQIANGTGSADFGTTTVGTPVEKTFTIRNDGGLNLTLSGATLPAGFAIVTPFSSPVAPGATTSLVVRLTATTVGTFGGNISFTTNDATANPFSFAVSGTVENLPPQIVVAVNTANVASGANVDLGTTSAGRNLRTTFTIRNTGGSPLAINSIVVPPGFSRDPSVITADTVAPGGATTFVLVMEASSQGELSGQITLRTNDPDESDFRFTVSGTVGARQLYLPLITR